MSGSRSDLLIVGAGPAGLACAIHAAKLGLRVRALEQRTPPLDKACGEGLMPDGLVQLEALGVSCAQVGGRPFEGIRFVDGDLAAEGRFPAGPGRGIRRLALHRALVESAESCGVEISWSRRFQGLDEGDAAQARWVVGADGLHSRVARVASLDRVTRQEAPRFGVRRHVRLSPWTNKVEVHFGDGVEAYVTPVAEDEVGVALLYCPRSSPGGASFESLLARFPALASRLGGREWTSEARGAGPLLRRSRCVDERLRVALVGDAAGYVDAITGEGMSLAFHEARELAACIARGSLRGYERRVRALRRLPDGTTRLMLWLKERPRLRRRAIAALAEDPRLFDRMLAVHGRQMTPHRVGVARLARLSLRVAGAWR